MSTGAERRGEDLLVKYHIAPPRCGISIPYGWRGLVEALLVDLLAMGWDGKVDQIKEKFDELRFYLADDTNATDAMNNRIGQAEMLSRKTCDGCGGALQERSRCPVCEG